MKILIVEDDPNLRALWRAVFGAEGYDVSTCGTALAARKKLMTHSFDLVLLDFYLGRETSLSVAAVVTYRNPYCKVVIVTGSTDLTAEKLMEMSPAVVAVLRKPVDIEHLVAVCAHIRPDRRAMPVAFQGRTG